MAARDADEAMTPPDEQILADAEHLPPADVATVLESLEPDERCRELDRLPPDLRTAVFQALDAATQADLIGRLETDDARELLEALETDDRTHLFEHLPEDQREATLDLLGPEARWETVRLLRYPPDSVGRLMSLTVAAVAAHRRVAEALERLRTQDFGPDAIGTVYVTDPDGRLVDALELPCLVLADPGVDVRSIMDGIYVSITPEEDREQAVRLMQKHDLTALPVVDEAGVLLGTVAIDDVMDVAEEEATEDIQQQAGIAPLRAAYPDVAVGSLFIKRLPWLAALIFVYLGASGVIAAFEDALAAEIVLAAFIPLLMGSGGNVGAQSGTLIVRAIAVGDIAGGRWRTALNKELVVGLGLGLALGVLAGIVAWARSGGDIAVVVAISMLVIVVSANLTGMLLPVLLDRLGIDPAVAASPVITSVTDLTSLLIYLGIAAWLLAL